MEAAFYPKETIEEVLPQAKMDASNDMIVLLAKVLSNPQALELVKILVEKKQKLFRASMKTDWKRHF